MNRPKIEEIAITFKTNGGLGKKVTVFVEPKDCSAIFFDDFSVENMLKKFYKENPGKMLGRDNSKKRFGTKITDELFGTNLEIEITEDIINKIWTDSINFDEQLPFIVKRPPCDLE